MGGQRDGGPVRRGWGGGGGVLSTLGSIGPGICRLWDLSWVKVKFFFNPEA